MADDARPLSDEERAELEALRAEKAAREAREQAARERAELEALRTQHAQAQVQAQAQTRAQASTPQRRVESAEDRRIREQRERGAQLMEPDDDLNMPMGQKVVLGVIVVLALIILCMTFLTQR